MSAAPERKLGEILRATTVCMRLVEYTWSAGRDIRVYRSQDDIAVAVNADVLRQHQSVPPKYFGYRLSKRLINFGVIVGCEQVAHRSDNTPQF
jgi:hypothetical protein